MSKTNKHTLEKINERLLITVPMFNYALVNETLQASYILRILNNLFLNTKLSFTQTVI